MATITVFSPCDCSLCADPSARWFQCDRIDARLIARYDCEDAIEEPGGHVFEGSPSRRAIREVEAAHPGMVLVYLDA